MMIETTIIGDEVSSELLRNFFKILVNRFFKILPMWEHGEESLQTYIVSLQHELVGCGSYIPSLGDNPMFLTLLSILQFLHTSGCEVAEVRREIFSAISICNKLEALYADNEGGEC